MALLATVLFLVLSGLVVLFLAFSGGPKGARRRMQTQSRRGRRSAVVLFLASIVVLGVAIPVAVIAADKGKDAIPEAGINQLTAEQKRGRELFGQRCRNCHTLKAANASARVGPSLDEIKPPAALTLDAIENGRARGNGNMAADLVEGEEARAVASFVAAATGGAQQ